VPAHRSRVSRTPRASTCCPSNLGCLGVHQADEQDRNRHRSQTEENEQSNQPEQRIYLGQHISLHASAEELPRNHAGKLYDWGWPEYPGMT
jgi:hypothetical protein